MKSPFLKFTILFSYNGGLSIPIDVVALNIRQAQALAKKQLEMAYGTALASQHTIIE